MMLGKAWRTALFFIPKAFIGVEVKALRKPYKFFQTNFFGDQVCVSWLQ